MTGQRTSLPTMTGTKMVRLNFQNVSSTRFKLTMTEERADNNGTVVSDNGNQKSLIEEKCGLMHFKDFSPTIPSTLQSTL